MVAHNEDGASAAPSNVTAPIGGSAVNRAASAMSKKAAKKARHKAKASKKK